MQMNTSMKKSQTHRQREQTRGCQRGGGGGREKVCEVDRRRLLYIERAWINSTVLLYSTGFPDISVGKESARSAGDPGSIPGSGRSPGEGKGYPLQYSGLKNSINCIVHGVTKSWT